MTLTTFISGLKLKLLGITEEQLDPFRNSEITLQGNRVFSSWEQDASAMHQEVSGVNNARAPSAARKRQDISFKSQMAQSRNKRGKH